MTPSDKTISFLDSRLREIKDPEEAIRVKERLLKEARSTRMGWALFGLGVFILVALTMSIVFGDPSSAMVLGMASFAALLCFGGGALIQGVRLDRIITVWKKNGGSGGN